MPLLSSIQRRSAQHHCGEGSVAVVERLLSANSCFQQLGSLV